MNENGEKLWITLCCSYLCHFVFVHTMLIQAASDCEKNLFSANHCFVYFNCFHFFGFFNFYTTCLHKFIISVQSLDFPLENLILNISLASRLHYNDCICDKNCNRSECDAHHEKKITMNQSIVAWFLCEFLFVSNAVILRGKQMHKWLEK